MFGRNKRFARVHITGIFAALLSMGLILLTGCGLNRTIAAPRLTAAPQAESIAPSSTENVKSNLSPSTPIPVETAAANSPAKPITENIPSSDASQDINEDINNLLYLKDGNTKTLVGFAFGDAFDYNLFDIAGSSGGKTMYRLKDSDNADLCFFFNGTGNRFSGLAAYGGEGNFFGINLGEDTLDEVIAVLGEPDEYHQASGIYDDSYATYLFKTATLKICSNYYSSMWKYGEIVYIEYNEIGSLANAPVPSDGQTEFEQDAQAGGQNIETIYGWDNDYFCQDNTSGTNDPKQTSIYYYPPAQLLDDAQKAALVKTYLQAHGTYKETPDGETLDNQGRPLAEVYLNEDTHEVSFIIHLWDDYVVDVTTMTHMKTDGICCTTLQMNETGKAGTLISNLDPDQNITQERLYDAEGKRMASVSYQYIGNAPFPFVIDSWNINAGYDLIGSSLCRNQKIWFDKGAAVFDQQGRFTGYNGSAQADGTKGYLPGPSKCVYDTTGRIEAIQEDLLDFDAEMGWGGGDTDIDYSGQIKFSYDKSGHLTAADYLRSSYSYGTWDSSGDILYDKSGRMIMNSYYVTHGGQDHIFLYAGDAKMPWACIYLDNDQFIQIYLFMSN